MTIITAARRCRATSIGDTFIDRPVVGFDLLNWNEKIFEDERRRKNRLEFYLSSRLNKLISRGEEEDVRSELRYLKKKSDEEEHRSSETETEEIGEGRFVLRLEILAKGEEERGEERRKNKSVRQPERTNRGGRFASSAFVMRGMCSLSFRIFSH